MPHLILFDIDGTLVLTGGAGGRALTRAFHDVFLVDDAFRGIPMPIVPPTPGSSPGG